MHRLVGISFILAALFAFAAAAPAGGLTAAPPGEAPRREIITFVSRAELQRLGLITPSRGSRSVRTQALCVWDCIHIRNARYLRTVRPFVTMVQGNGPSTIAIDVSRTVRNSFSATVNVSAEVVSTGVGFNVERSETVAYRSSTTVPNRACWTIRAYNVFFEYGFEVWKEPFIGSDTKLGSGVARDFQGIEFRLSKWC